MVVSLGEFGLLFALPLFLQATRGYDALQTGYILLALAVGSFFASGLGAPLSQRFGPVRVLQLGMALEVVGIFGLGFVLSPTITGWQMVPWLFLYGMGVGFATAQLTGVVLSEVPVTESGQASAVQSTSRQVGAAIGTAIIGTTLIFGLGSVAGQLEDRGVPAEQAQQISDAVASSAGQAIQALPDATPEDKLIIEGASAGFADAIKLVAWVAGGFVLFGLFASLALPKNAARIESEGYSPPAEKTEIGVGVPSIVVIGHADVGRRACAQLAARGVRTLHLDDPSDAELRDALSGTIDGVAVLLHDDMRALRYCLVVEHVRPGIRLFVAMFDGTARAQLERAVPNCVVLSPAAVAVPSMVAAAVVPEHVAVRRRGTSQERRWVTIDSAPGSDRAGIHPFEPSSRLRLRGLLGMLRGQLHPYDAGSSVLLGGAFGLLLVIVVDTLVGLRHESAIRALYDAARTTATISAPDLPDEAGLLLWATLAALLVMGFTAAFAAGIVHHLISGRHVALIGRRVMPRSGHVIVAGVGQVGLRLAQELRALGDRGRRHRAVRRCSRAWPSPGTWASP